MLKKTIIGGGLLLLLILGLYLDFFSFEGALEVEGPTISLQEAKVYITGEVMKPGVYEVKADTRLGDLIDLAGGLTEQADQSRLNLAQHMEDGQKIEIYPRLVQETSKDINTMTLEDLQEIEGIGKELALRIDAYRKEKGYIGLDDLIEVEGIGEAKLSLIKQHFD